MSSQHHKKTDDLMSDSEIVILQDDNEQAKEINTNDSMVINDSITNLHITSTDTITDSSTDIGMQVDPIITDNNELTTTNNTLDNSTDTVHNTNESLDTTIDALDTSTDALDTSIDALGTESATTDTATNDAITANIPLQQTDNHSIPITTTETTPPTFKTLQSPDYYMLLNTKRLLESQMSYCKQAITQLENQKKQALSDPLKFIQSLQASIHSKNNIKTTTYQTDDFNSIPETNIKEETQEQHSSPQDTSIEFPARMSDQLLRIPLLDLAKYVRSGSPHETFILSLLNNLQTKLVNQGRHLPVMMPSMQSQLDIANSMVQESRISSMNASSIPNDHSTSPYAMPYTTTTSMAPSAIHSTFPSMPPTVHHTAIPSALQSTLHSGMTSPLGMPQQQHQPSSAAADRISVERARKLPGYRMTMTGMPSASSTLASTGQYLQPMPSNIPNQTTNKRAKTSSGSGSTYVRLTNRPHNPWGPEETKRMIELLEQFPEEDIQSRRFEKIAAVLGTRTGPQVTSKYNNLIKTGVLKLPIMPSSGMFNGKQSKDS